jgi:hypothetical protein
VEIWVIDHVLATFVVISTLVPLVSLEATLCTVRKVSRLLTYVCSEIVPLMEV